MTQEATKDKQPLEQIQEAYEKNKNLFIGIGVVIVLVVAFFLYRGYQKTSQTKAAAPLMEMPQQYFAADSFNLALYGDGLNPGFLEIIDKYGRSKYGNLAEYYAGVSFLQLGDYENAITYLKSFSTESEMLRARKYESLGHAYAQIGDTDAAMSQYKKAYKAVENDFYTPYLLQLAGDFMMQQGDFEGALQVYEEIQQQYPNSREGQQINRFIEHAEAEAKKS